MKDESADRIEKLLGVLLINSMKGATQAEKALQLSLAGFTNVEIADLLQTTPAVVASLMYQTRKKKAR